MSNHGIREAYNLESTASAEDVVAEICRRVARALRGTGNVMGLIRVGSHLVRRTDDVDVGSFKSARALICEHYGLSAGATDGELLAQVDQVGLEVLCYLRDIREVAALCPEKVAMTGCGVEYVRNLCRKIREGRPTAIVVFEDDIFLPSRR